MKLETSIKPRADGSVRFIGLDGILYVGQFDSASGLLIVDVNHEPTLAWLLRTGNFFPANEADHDKAAVLIDLIKDPSAEDEDEPDDLEDDEVDPNALPLEAGTPPAPRKKKAKAE